MSQNAKLKALLKKQWVTPQDALRHAGCFRLAARVKDCRDRGIVVHDRWIESDGKRFKAYRILGGK